MTRKESASTRPSGWIVKRTSTYPSMPRRCARDGYSGGTRSVGWGDPTSCDGAWLDSPLSAAWSAEAASLSPWDASFADEDLKRDLSAELLTVSAALR